MSNDNHEIFNEVADKNKIMFSDSVNELKSYFDRMTYEPLQEIVAKYTRSTAGYMSDFIHDQINDVFRKMLDLRYETFVSNINNATNSLLDRIGKVEDERDLAKKIDIYENQVTNSHMWEFDFDNMIYNYIEDLRNLIKDKFKYMYSSDIDRTIDNICGESKSVLIKSFGEIKTKLDNLRFRINEEFLESIKLFEKSYRIEKEKAEDEKSFKAGFDEYTFRFNGDEIVYRYDGNELNCYMNGKKVINISALESINRTLQDEFHDDKYPGVTRVTDSMVRRISEMKMDEQNPEDLFNPRAQRREPSANELAFIDGPIRGNILDNPELLKKEEEIKGVAKSLEIKDDDEPKRELTEEEKAKRTEEIAKVTEALDIKDEEEQKEEDLDGVEDWLKDVVKSITSPKKEEPINPNASTDSKDLELTQEELEALLGDLSIPEATVEAGTSEKEEPKVKKPTREEMGHLQDRLEYLSKTPEVLEYLEIQEYLNAVNEYQDRVAAQEQDSTMKIV